MCRIVSAVITLAIVDFNPRHRVLTVHAVHHLHISNVSEDRGFPARCSLTFRQVFHQTSKHRRDSTSIKLRQSTFGTTAPIDYRSALYGPRSAAPCDVVDRIGHRKQNNSLLIVFSVNNRFPDFFFRELDRINRSTQKHRTPQLLRITYKFDQQRNPQPRLLSVAPSGSFDLLLNARKARLAASPSESNTLSLNIRRVAISTLPQRT
jgi:hypothetical protein